MRGGARRLSVARDFVWMLLAVVAAGCAADATPTVVSGPYDPGAEIRPDLIVAEPTRPAAGDVVALTFPEDSSRGIHFVLEQRVGDRWNLIYHLLSSADLSESSYFAPGEDDIAIPDIGISGPGPDRVPIPEDVSPGSYRICTANAGDEFCAEIEVVAP